MTLANEEKYQQRIATPADINEHLPTLRRLASGCRKATEIGTWTGCSATGLLMGLLDSPEEGRTLQVIDINESYLNGTYEWLSQFETNGDPRVQFLLGDSRKIEIDTTDILLIDSWHIYDQLHTELELHAKDVRKYIVMHDTVTFGIVGEDGKSPGLMDAVDDFLAEYGDEWEIAEQHDNNNGLTVLRRTSGGPKGYFLKVAATARRLGLSF